MKEERRHDTPNINKMGVLMRTMTMKIWTQTKEFKRKRNYSRRRKSFLKTISTTYDFQLWRVESHKNKNCFQTEENLPQDYDREILSVFLVCPIDFRLKIKSNPEFPILRPAQQISNWRLNIIFHEFPAHCTVIDILDLSVPRIMSQFLKINFFMYL